MPTQAWDMAPGCLDSQKTQVSEYRDLWHQVTRNTGLDSDMNHPSLTPTRIGQVPTETYGQAHIHWLASKAASGATELTFGLTTIAPGGSSPLHRHPNCEEVLHLLRGEIEKVIEGVPSFRMHPGDTITVPRNLKHRAINVGTGPAEMIVVFSSPERETIVEESPAA